MLSNNYSVAHNYNKQSYAIQFFLRASVLCDTSVTQRWQWLQWQKELVLPQHIQILWYKAFNYFLVVSVSAQHMPNSLGIWEIPWFGPYFRVFNDNLGTLKLTITSKYIICSTFPWCKMTVTIDLGSLGSCPWRIIGTDTGSALRWKRVGGDVNMWMTVNRSTCSCGGVADNKMRWVEFRLRVTLVAVRRGPVCDKGHAYWDILKRFCLMSYPDANFLELKL